MKILRIGIGFSTFSNMQFRKLMSTLGLCLTDMFDKYSQMRENYILKYFIIRKYFSDKVTNLILNVFQRISIVNLK